MEASLNINAKLGVMYANQYGDMAATEVPIHSLSKFEAQKLKEQALSGFKSAQLVQKVDSLQEEVTSLKSTNAELEATVQALNSKIDVQATSTADILLNQQ